MSDSIGWIGLGRMGEAMVKRLLKAGHVVSVQTSEVQTVRRKRGLTGRHKQQQSARGRTVWELTESQGSVSFCSSAVRENVRWA